MMPMAYLMANQIPTPISASGTASLNGRSAGVSAPLFGQAFRHSPQLMHCGVTTAVLFDTLIAMGHFLSQAPQLIQLSLIHI